MLSDPLTASVIARRLTDHQKNAIKWLPENWAEKTWWMWIKLLLQPKIPNDNLP